VVTWRGGSLVDRCLASLQAQALPPGDLLVVVASARPDLAPRGFDVHVMSKPSGFARSANAGLRAVRQLASSSTDRTGRDVILLNDDTIAEPDFIAALHRARMTHGEGVYQPRILLADGSGRMDNSGHHLFFDGFNLARGRGWPEPSQIPPEAGAFSGAAVLLTRQVLARVGLFDEDLEAFGEDVDLSLRAVRQGYRIRTVSDARIAHVLGASYGRASAHKIYLVERNRVRAAVRSLPASALLSMPLWMSLRLAGLGLAATRGMGLGADIGVTGMAAVAAGTAAGLGRIPGAWRKRRRDRVDWVVGERAMWRHLFDHRVRRCDLSGHA
ncbi:MAG: glycosyltransferase family 2 protein, partial [Oligoflexia bacterium]|nr:glycosyltransferase family 2 protein [Oligoflexia bacterium]